MSLTAKRLREVLDYDPETGEFWRKMPASRRHPEPWVEPAGGFAAKGYLAIKIDGKCYKSHRLAWLYMTGQWPADQIDHINRVKTDNRFSNLRECNNAQNQANSIVRHHNRSGLKGAHYYTAGKCWTSKIVKNGQKRFLGMFQAAQEAHEAYAAAARALHGDYARI